LIAEDALGAPLLIGRSTDGDAGIMDAAAADTAADNAEPVSGGLLVAEKGRNGNPTGGIVVWARCCR